MFRKVRRRDNPVSLAPVSDMAKPMRISVTDWAGWTTGPDNEGVKRLPALMRRRLSPLGRNALGAACLQPSVGTARYIFSSRHGEFIRTRAILQSIAAGAELSPTDFSMSVHHALAGILSIAHHNHSGHTAIAAGTESLFLAMTEAAACLTDAPHQPVLLLHYDEALPEEYAPFDTMAQTSVLALCLETSGGVDMSLTMTDKQQTEASPIPAATAFWQFLQSGQQNFTYHAETHSWYGARHGMA